MAKQKHDYFAAFARQVELAVEEADLLIGIVENFTTADDVEALLPKAHEIESQADDVAHGNYNAIAVDFITPLDRDDIFELTHAMDSVVDRIEAVIQSFYMTNVQRMHEDALPMARLIKQGCEALKDAMGPFSDFKHKETFHKAIMRANDFEEEADQVYMTAIRRLHTEDFDNPTRLLIWTRIFVGLEACCDAFEHVADLMGSIYLKNS